MIYFNCVISVCDYDGTSFGCEVESFQNDYLIYQIIDELIGELWYEGCENHNDVKSNGLYFVQCGLDLKNNTIDFDKWVLIEEWEK